MAYQIDRYNGTLLVSIDDQTINTTATDLRLVGRNYAGYGEIQNENFLHLLENFANSSPPARPIAGQIWYDSVNKKLKFYDGNKFKTTSGAEASAVPPAGLASGDFWWDTINEQLFSWNGVEFILVGPERAPTLGQTEAIPQVVIDAIGSSHGIIKLQVDGIVVGIVSNEEFSLNPVINPIDGFFDVKKGINLRSTDAQGISSEHYFWGTASNADKLDGFTADDFLRAGNTRFTSLTRFSDSGLTVGDQNDLGIKVINGNEIVIESSLGQPIIFRNLFLSETRDIALIRDDGIVPGSTDQYYLGRTGIRWKEIHSETVRAETFYGKFVGTIESPAPGTPGGPPIGQPIPPLVLQSGLEVSGSFSMSGASGGNFEIDLEGTSGAVSLSSGAVGSINNFNIGQTIPGSGNFTSLSSSGLTRITNTTESNSVSTGSLVVSGGVGIAKNLYVGGNVGFVGGGALIIPVGTSAQRPTSPVIGMIRYNTELQAFEGYDGEDWRVIGDSGDDYGELTGEIQNTFDYRFISELEDASLDYGGLF